MGTGRLIVDLVLHSSYQWKMMPLMAEIEVIVMKRLSVMENELGAMKYQLLMNQ
jgi:hypothetical protein